MQALGDHHQGEETSKGSCDNAIDDIQLQGSNFTLTSLTWENDLLGQITDIDAVASVENGLNLYGDLQDECLYQQNSLAAREADAGMGPSSGFQTADLTSPDGVILSNDSLSALEIPFSSSPKLAPTEPEIYTYKKELRSRAFESIASRNLRGSIPDLRLSGGGYTLGTQQTVTSNASDILRPNTSVKTRNKRQKAIKDRLVERIKHTGRRKVNNNGANSSIPNKKAFAGNMRGQSNILNDRRVGIMCGHMKCDTCTTDRGCWTCCLCHSFMPRNMSSCTCPPLL